MTRLDRTGAAVAGAAALVIVALALVLVGRGDETEAAARGGSYQKRFDALREFGPGAEAGLSPIERERLSFRRLMMSHELAAAQGRAPGEAERPEVHAYGRLELPSSGSVAMAAIGDSVCAWYVRGVGICGLPEQIETTGVAGSTRIGGGRWRVLAIVPEGVETVEADPDGDGAFAFRAPVRSGVYSGEFPGRSIRVRGLDRDGEVVFRDTVPLDRF